MDIPKFLNISINRGALYKKYCFVTLQYSNKNGGFDNYPASCCTFVCAEP